MAEKDYDLLVIGSGPGGYVAAIRAAQLGLRTACVDKRATLGGTCLNVGCIPSKALLSSSFHYEEVKKHLAPHGIKIGSVDFDLDVMMARKRKVVDDNTKGIDFLFKKHKITRLTGEAHIIAPGTVEVTGLDKPVTATSIIIASGSEAAPLSGAGIDEKQIVSSTGVLELSSVPQHLVVIGAGVIGLELGSVWRRLGSRVTVVEFLDHILPQHDREIAKQMQRILERQGMAFKLGTKVTAAKTSETGVTLSLEAVHNGSPAEELNADVVLVAIGRRPYTQGLGLQDLGVTVDTRGFIKVDARFQTSVPGVYAIGDVIGGIMLAHKAEDEGMAAAEIVAGHASHINYNAIPGIVYTWPEVANVGKTEEQLKAEGIPYKIGKFPFTANGRARANGDTTGFVKLLAHAQTDRLLGAHIIGPSAGDLIGELVLGMEFSAAAEDIALTCHAHPTLGEAVREAALAIDNRPIHV